MCVDIRRFFKIPSTQQLQRTKVGVPLTFAEYEALVKGIRYVRRDKHLP